MIEFRGEKGRFACESCFAEAENGRFTLNAKAIVEGGAWYWIAACDDERHIAAALQRHAYLSEIRSDWMPWADVKGRASDDYLSTLEEMWQR